MVAPKVSVIIPTFNCAVYIDEAIRSVLNQTYKDFEIVVVDDGSTDNTQDVLKPYKEASLIRYYFQDNQGVSGSRNRGLKEAKGKYIAFLDADDVWLSERLEEEVRILDEKARVGLVHARTARISEEGKVVETPFRDPRYLSGHIFKALFLRRANISSPTVLFRRECFEKIGYYDENLSRLGCEDRDYWLRIALDYEIVFVDKVLAYYRLRKGSFSKDIFKMIEGRYYVVNKFCGQGKRPILKRQALERIHKEIADDLLQDSDYREAMKEYKKALLYWPFSFWSWVNLAKCFLKG